MTPGLADLAEVYELRCCRCGKPGPDTAEDPGALEALLNPRPLPHVAGIVPPFGIRRISQADIEACRPVHRKCPEPRRRENLAPYRIERSVA